MLKIVIGTNEGKVLCISNNEDEIKASMVSYLIDTDQEPTEDFFESRNWGEYDIEVYEYQQPQLNENQQIVLNWLKEEKTNSSLTAFDCIYSFIYGNPKDLVTQIWSELNEKEECQVLEAFGKWAQEQEED
ncbi:hypothetical protein [Enterococcus entomosocium]|uniref:hypothetical protein n=1 Tax=Enterococcus entomosocium TaxID=3034352 RepID=UPI0026475026|nr:hypothetical protein [Enterococcus entomosocium]